MNQFEADQFRKTVVSFEGQIQEMTDVMDRLKKEVAELAGGLKYWKGQAEYWKRKAQDRDFSDTVMQAMEVLR